MEKKTPRVAKKKCSRCGRLLPLEEFYVSRKCRDGRLAQCKECRNEIIRLWHKKINMTEDGREKQKKARRKARLSHRHNLTLEAFDALLEEQGNTCAICQRKFEKSGQLYPVVDHDHTTKEIRGLLCDECNKMLGLAKDSTNTLFAAIQYLEKGGISHGKEAS